MSHPMPSAPPAPLLPLSFWKAALYVVGAVACFHVAYQTPFGILIFGYVACLTQLVRVATPRFAFYAALLTSLLCVAPQSTFFYGIFGPFGAVLWTVLAFWTALYVVLAHITFRRLGPPAAIWLAAAIWMGLEYFRGELYYLRFSWLNVGYAMSVSHATAPLQVFGMYGLGFLAAFLGACWLVRAYKSVLAAAVVVLVVCPLLAWPSKVGAGRSFQIAGVQMEFPTTDRLLANLDALAARYPDAQLLVVSEYACDGPIPDKVKTWCHDRRRYLVIGGEDPAPGGSGAYYNTAFVVGPDGGIVFKQAKSVPIQFFADGLPAPEQRVWSSPWGKIGICICYDLSYRRVTDRLVRLGALALIVPTMDVERWGRREHELHRRVAPVRAAEYGIPIFRVASSGISQAVGGNGRELAAAPFPGEDATIAATLGPADGTRPLDTWLAPAASVVTAGWAAVLALGAIRRRWRSGWARSDGIV